MKLGLKIHWRGGAGGHELLNIMLYLITSVVAMPHVGQEQGMKCSSEFVLHNSYCYRYFGFGMRKPFHHAQKLCSRYESSLVSLHSWQEEHFVVRLALNVSGFWIGLNDEDDPGGTDKEGLFKWSSGELFEPSYCRWKPGEPQNKKHLDCVKVDKYGWAMAPGGCGSSRLPFVCKKKASPAEMKTKNNKLPWSTSPLLILLVVAMVIITSAGLFGIYNSIDKELFPT